MKPDYHEMEDVDCVIIGACKGEGWRGGEVHEFILALPDCPGGEGTPPVAFKSFCK
jgi:ATP-dependent DNA ligase